MLDTGSPRVFNCSELTQRILTKDPNATPFFRNKPLNNIVLIKDAIPESDRKPGMPFVGTKLYFPFNEGNIYEGGRTIFLQDKYLLQALTAHYGESALSKDLLDEDLRIMSILDKLPSLDPFLMKDVFLREGATVNTDYFEVSQETWNEIESYMLQKFEPLVTAAFPDTESSDDKARQLIDKIWEAHDIPALQPLIDAFRLPQSDALNIFLSWKGIVYYSYQYQKEQPNMINMFKWLRENEVPVAGITAAENKEFLEKMALIKDQLRKEWQTVDEVVREYQESYDKMFKFKTSSAEFLTFLKNSSKTYWVLGNSLGKASHGVYCWDVMSSRFKERKVPWQQMQETMRLLSTVFQPEKKSTTSVSWG